MNLKVSIKYQLHDNQRGIFIFYGVVVCVIILVMSLMLLPVKSTIRGNIGGMELATVIFLFVAGMNSFRETFRMFLQNGISRKTLFIGRVICTALIGSGMALIDNILSLIMKRIMPALSGEYYSGGFFEMLYGARFEMHPSGILMFVEGLLFTVCLYAAASMCGYFITAVYYRLNKSGKIAVSVGVWAGLFFVLPIVDGLIFRGRISQAFSRIVMAAFGFSNGVNPYFGMLTLLLIFAAFSGLSWLLVRKAVAKD